MTTPDDAWLITVPDGTAFRCYLDGSEWKFTRVSDGKSFVGPRANRPITHPEELRGVVTNWWALQKALAR